MNNAKITKALVLLLLAASSLLVSSCKDNTTEPEYLQEYDSEAAADMNASALGTDAGGAGVGFEDSYTLMTEGNIATSTFDGKVSTPQERLKEFDPITKAHKLTIDRHKENGKFIFDAVIIYTYTFYDKSGNKMDSLIKNQTDRIEISVSKERTGSKGERIDVEDNATGSWNVTDILSGTPILNGLYNREGSITFHTKNNGDRVLDYTLNIQFTNDTLVRKDNGTGKYTYLQGKANSTFTGTSRKNGNTFERKTDITFNGDGTATLEVTRTSGDGSVDTYTIDVKVGKWLRKGK